MDTRPYFELIDGEDTSLSNSVGQVHCWIIDRYTGDGFEKASLLKAKRVSKSALRKCLNLLDVPLKTYGHSYAKRVPKTRLPEIIYKLYSHNHTITLEPLVRRHSETIDQEYNFPEHPGRYPPNWDQIRRNVYARDGFQCTDCGAKGGSNGDTELHAHHQTPISDGGSHQMSNLRTLCYSCHDNVHPHIAF